MLRGCGPGRLFANSGRGPCVDGAALKSALGGGRLRGAFLDVFEDEPVVDSALLDLLQIGTPHIAGYSLDGRFAVSR